MWADRLRWGWLGLALAAWASTFTLRWRPSNDSAEMLVIARQLSEGGRFQTLGGYHLGVMPGYPWLLGALERLGEAATLAIGLNALAFAAWVAFVFAWVRRSFDRSTAVVVAVMCACSARALEAAADVLPGMLFATLLAALLWWDARARGAVARLIGGGLLVGLMIGLRSVGLLVGLAWIASLGWRWCAGHGPGAGTEADAEPIDRERPWLRILLGLAGLGAVVAMLPAVRDDAAALWNGWTTRGLSHAAWSSWETVSSAVPEAIFGIDPTPYGGVVLTGLALVGVVLLTRERPAWGLLVAALALPWLLFLATPRYVVPVLPLLYLGLWLAVRWAQARRSGLGWRVGLALAWAALFAGNAVGVGRLAYEQRQTPFLEHFRGGRFATARATADWLQANTEPGARVICTSRRRAVLSYWSDRAVLERFGRPAINAGRLLVIEPADEPFHLAMERYAGSVSAPLATFEGPRRTPTWTVHEVTLPDALGASGGKTAPTP